MTLLYWLILLVTVHAAACAADAEFEQQNGLRNALTAPSIVGTARYIGIQTNGVQL